MFSASKHEGWVSSDLAGNHGKESHECSVPLAQTGWARFFQSPFQAMHSTTKFCIKAQLLFDSPPNAEEQGIYSK